MINTPFLLSDRYPSIGKVLLCSFFMLSCYSLSAQQKLTSDAFFQERWTALNTLLGSESAHDKFRGSWLNKIDFRTETDEFNIDRQQYLLRVSPSTGKIRKAQSQLHQEYLNEATFEKEKYKESMIQKAYEDWLEIYEKTERLSLERAMLEVMSDEQVVIQKLAAASMTSAKEVAEIQQEMNDLKIDIYTHENELNLLYGPNEEIDFSDLIPLETIRQKITLDSDLSRPLVDQARVQKMNKIEAELQLERAEKSQYFDFFQVQYSGPHRDVWEEKLSLTLGFTIPFSSDRKLKMQALNIEKESLKKEQQIVQTLQQEKVAQQLNTIQLLFKKWDFIQSLNSQSGAEAQGLVQRENAESIATPLWQLSQKAEEIKNNYQELDTEMAIYRAYIRLLDLTAILYQPPFVNYLKTSS